MGDRNTFGNFDFFFGKKNCIIRLDELFPKILVSDPKTTCERCGEFLIDCSTYAKIKN